MEVSDENINFKEKFQKYADLNQIKMFFLRVMNVESTFMLLYRSW